MARTSAELIQEAILRANAIMTEPGGKRMNVATLKSFDPETFRTLVRSKWSYELWDRKSPINGVPADTVLEKRHDIPAEGEIYLLKRDGQVIYFQPHEPKQGGHAPMTKDSVTNFAVQHLAEMIDEETMNVMLAQI